MASTTFHTPSIVSAAPLFTNTPRSRVPYPIQHVVIDWERLSAKRPLVLQTITGMPRYLLKPEVLALLAAETDPRYRLLLDLMWTTGGRVSEILALTPSAVVNDGYDVGVLFQTLKQSSGSSKLEKREARKRYVPIVDERLKERMHSFLWSGSLKKDQRLFPMARQTVTRRVHRLVESVGGAPFNITAHTFRHSFAIHLLLHGRPLKYVSQLLGHRSVDSTEIYTNVLTADGVHFLEGVDFH